jgi:NAD(P)H-dependent FMN reductase
MNKIIVFAGSNSKNSINKQLAQCAANKLQKVPFEILDLNDYPLPLFSVDVEKESGYPDPALKFDVKIAGALGIILSLAEHNGSYTAAFKNLFDWLSRIDGKVWKKRPMLLLSTSPGARGGKSVLSAAKDRFPWHDSHIIETYSLPYFGDNFKEGFIINASLESQLADAVLKFEESIEYV